MLQAQTRFQQDVYEQTVAVFHHGESKEDVAWLEIKRSGEKRISVPWPNRRVPLTRRGINEVRRCAVPLATFFPPGPLTIFPSTYLRTQQTAEELALSIRKHARRRRANIAVSIAKPRHELDTRHLGKNWDLSVEGIRDLDPEEYELLLEQGVYYCPPGHGENLPARYQKVGAFLEREVFPARENMLFVGHSTTTVFMWGGLSGCDLKKEDIWDIANSVSVPNAHAMIFRRRHFEHTAGPWRLIDQLWPQ